MLTVIVHGLPAPQGSKRHVGNGVMIESSKNVKPWREAVKHAALDALGRAQYSFSGPVILEIVFTLPKPKSAPKNRITYPDKKPDISKLIRSTEDALTDAGVWEDDARVIDEHALKVFPGEHPDALPHPGAVIRIRSAAAALNKEGAAA